MAEIAEDFINDILFIDGHFPGEPSVFHQKFLHFAFQGIDTRKNLIKQVNIFIFHGCENDFIFQSFYFYIYFINIF